MAHGRFRAVFSDIGGVLGTNGWDTRLRRKIAEHFRCDFEDIERRHQLIFDSFERGYMLFERYLQHVFFGSPRDFGVKDVRRFAYRESIAWPENILFLQAIRRANDVKLGLISNEGEGLTEYRVKTFGLREAADFLIFSHFVHMRKPDREIWQLALNLAQVKAREAIYIDDREMFVDIAADMGFTALHYVSLASMRDQMQRLGLSVA